MPGVKTALKMNY